MAGMLWKDICYMKKMKKTLIYIILLFIMLSAAGIIDKQYTLFYLTIFFCINLSTLPFSYDSYSHWSEYQYALPVSKKTAVYSRYLFGLLIFGCCFVFQALSAIILSLFFQTEIGNTTDFIFIQFSILLFVPLLQAILFPILYRFGSEKGRLYMVGIIIILFSIAGFLSSIMETEHFSIRPLSLFTTMFLLTAVLYAFSLFLSIKIEQKKQK